MQRRNWCWTWNNPGGTRPALPESARYHIYQLERGEAGTEHLQGYVEFKRSIRMSTVKSAYGNNALHCEPRMGSREQARDYCKKPDTRVDGPFEHGEWVADGERTDVAAFVRAVREGKSDLELLDLQPAAFMRMHRAVDRVRAATLRANSQTFRHVETRVFAGQTGTGKTRSVYEIEGYDRVFTKQASMGDWWDGYCGQPVLLLDEFNGSWLRYEQLLNVLDGHPMQMQVKGNFTHAAWVRVYITSNILPEQWYLQGLTPALNRRLTHIYLYHDDYVEFIK